MTDIDEGKKADSEVKVLASLPTSAQKNSAQSSDSETSPDKSPNSKKDNEDEANARSQRRIEAKNARKQRWRKVKIYYLQYAQGSCN